VGAWVSEIQLQLAATDQRWRRSVELNLATPREGRIVDQGNGSEPVLKVCPLGCLVRMYSMADLLHVVHSDGADALKLHVGQPPIVVLDGKEQPLDGPAITTEDAEQFFQSVANTRQRRELREHGAVEFIYQFRGRASFVVRARMEDENVGMDIH
jgi:hypothetical protein